VPFEEGKIIHQHYKNFLYLTELFEFRLNEPLTIPFQLLEDTFSLVFMLQGETTITTSHGEVLDELLAGKCHASINAKEEYATLFQAETHIFARITPRIDWIRSLKDRFPRFVDLIERYQQSDAIILKTEKKRIDQHIRRALADIWKLSPRQYTDPDHEMTYRVQQVFKSYHEAIHQKHYLLMVPTADKIRTIGDYLQANANVTDIANIGHLSTHFFITERTLNRGFKKEYDMTIHKYVDAIRLKNACELLSETNIPIHKIARRCGFKSPNYFSRSFRKEFGYSPTEYRKIRTTA